MFHLGIFKCLCKNEHCGMSISSMECYAKQIVDFAHSKGIYTKDYEKRMEDAKQKIIVIHMVFLFIDSLKE